MEQPNEQEWMRWRIIKQMEDSAIYGDFTPEEIKEAKAAFGFAQRKEENHERV